MRMRKRKRLRISLYETIHFIYTSTIIFSRTDSVKICKEEDEEDGC